MLFVRLTRAIAGLCASIPVVLGGFALVAWGFGSWRAVAFGEGYVPMAPLTAASFLVLGLCLLCRRRWVDHRKLESLSQVAGWSVALISGTVLVQAFHPFPLPWDNWFLTSEKSLGMVPLGRMSPLTAVAFLLSAFGLPVGTFRSAGRLRLGLFRLASAVVSLMIAGMVSLSYAAGDPLLYGGDTVPMALLTAFAFLGLNSSLLFTVLAGEMARDAANLPAAPDLPLDRLRQFAGVAALIAMVTVVVGAGLALARQRQATERSAIGEELDSIADLKADAVSAWRQERLSEGRFLLRTEAVGVDVSTLARRPDDEAARSRVRGWLEPIKAGTRYESVAAVTPEGRVLVAIPESRADSLQPDQALLSSVIAAGDVLLGPLHRRTPSEGVRMDLLVPIRLPAAGRLNASGAAAVLVLTIDPEDVLFPLVRSLPRPSATAESLLVRDEGGLVTYLNEVRGQPATSLTLSRWLREFMATTRPDASGEFAVFEGLDDRGIPVLASLRRITDSPWSIVAKIDQSEALAGVRRDVWQGAVIATLLLLAALLSGAFVWRHRQAELLSSSLAAERERKAAAEQLALLTREANDAIFLLDPEMNVVEANDRVQALYGRSPEELKTLKAQVVRAPEAAATGPGDFLSALERGSVFTTLHQRRDGTTFPVEISARWVERETGPHILAVVRDITDLRLHEKEIERLNGLYASLSHVNQAIVRATDRDSFLRDVCRALVEQGPFAMAWVGQADPDTETVRPLAHWGDTSHYLHSIRITTDRTPHGQGPTGVAIREGRPQVVNDALNDPAMGPWREAARQEGFAAIMAMPVWIDPATRGSITVYAREAGYFGAAEIGLLEEAALDITFGLENLAREARRQKAAEDLRLSEERLRLALSATEQGLYDVDLQTGAIVVSPEYARLLGYDPATFRETNGDWLERLHPEDRDRVDMYYRDYLAGRLADYRIEFRMRTSEGEWKWVLSLGRIVQRAPDGSPVRMLGTCTDITERKLAEDALRTALSEQRALLKEVHHRVKNNLQVITSLLRLELGRSRETATQLVLHDMQSRIRSMAILHETLYRTGNFAGINLAEYLRQLATQLFRAHNADPGRIELETDLAAVQMDLDHAIPCGLLVNELLTNSLKHGFADGRSGAVRVTLALSRDGGIELRVADDGVGLPPDFQARHRGSLGLQLVSDLTRQLGGALEIGPGPGASFVVRFHPEHRRSAEIIRPSA